MSTGALAPESSQAALRRASVAAALSEARSRLEILQRTCSAADPDPEDIARQTAGICAAITRVADRLVPPGGAR